MHGRLGRITALGLATAAVAAIAAAGVAATATHTEGAAGAYGPAQPWEAHAQEQAPVRIGALMAPGDSFDDTQRIRVLRYAIDAFNSQSADVQLDLAVSNITRGQELAALEAAHSGGSGPSYYVGPTTSAGLESIMSYADANGVLLVSPASDAAQLAVQGDNTFRLTISVSRQASVLAGVMSDAGATEAVTVIRDDAWGSSFNASLGQALAARDIAVRGSVAFDAGAADWAAVAGEVNRTASLLRQGPGAAVVFAGFGGDYDGMAAELSAAAGSGRPGAAGGMPWFVPSAAIRGSTLAPIPDETTRSFSASVNLTALNHDVPSNAATDAIEANLTSAVRLPYYEYATYDSVFVLGNAIRLAAAPSALPGGGQPDPATVKAAMPYAALAHEGALGRIALDSSGDLLTPDSFSVWQVNETGGWARAAPAAAPAAAATPVVDIGMLALLANGHEAHRVAAARLAVNDYNWERERAAGPDGAGHYLHLRVYNISVDDSPPRAIDAIMDAAADGVSYIVGPSTSGNTQRVLGYANGNDIILVSPSATAPSLSIEGDNLFRLAPDDNRQGIILANVIDRDLSAAAGPKSVVVVARDDPWGRGLNSTAAGRLAALGVEVSPIAFQDGADWQSIASQIGSAAASLGGGGGGSGSGSPAVLFLGLAPDFEGIAPHAGTDLRWYGPDSLAASASLAGSEAARTFADAVNLTATLFHAEDNAVQAGVRDGLAAAGVSGLRVYDYSTYDSVRVLGAAIAAAAAAAAADGRAGPAAVGAAMPAAAARYSGALGDLALNAAGDLRTPDDYALWTMEDGAWKRLEVFRGTPVVEIGALVVLESDAFGDRQRLEAMRLAADEYNRANEAGGPMYIDIVEVPISISPAAATNSSPPAADALEAAYDGGSGPSLYVGPSTSGNAGRVLDFADRNGLTLVSPSSTAPSLAIADDSLFRLVPNDARQGVVLADIIHNQQGGILAGLLNESGAEHVVAVVRNDSWGRGLYDSAAARLGMHNITASQIVHLEHGTDWASAASRLNASVSSALVDGPAAVLHVGFRGDFAALAAEAGRYPALRGVAWYGTDGVAGAQSIIADAVAQEFADAVNLTATKFDVANGTRLAAVDAALRARGVAAPGVYVYASYDAVLVLAGAAERAMSAASAAGAAPYSAAAVRGEVRAAAAAYDGALGDIELNRAGDLRSPNGYAAWTVEGGEWKRVGMHPATPVVDIGALLVLDGNPSWSDERERAAIEVAVDDFNTEHELIGDFYLGLEVQRIRLSPGHDSPDPDALAGLEAAYAGGSGPSQYVGPTTSANAARVLDFANRNGLTLISPSSSAPSLAVAGDALFRLIPSQGSHAAVLAALLGERGVTDIVVAVRGDAWGLGANASLLSALPNGTRAASVQFAEAGVDWNATAAAIGLAVADARSSAAANSGRAAVVFAGFGSDFVALAEQAGARGALGPAVEWFSAGAIGTTPLVPASPAAVELAGAVNLTTTRFAPAANDVSARLDPSAEYGPSAYDSVRVLGSAIKAALGGQAPLPPPPAPADVRAAVPAAALEYRGALGNIVLDDAGDLLRPNTYGVYEVGAGGEWSFLRTIAPPRGPGDASAAAAAVRCPDGAVRCAAIGELYAPEVAAIDGGIHEAYALAVEDYNKNEAARNASDSERLYLQLERAEFSFASPLEGLRAAYANGSGPQAYLGPTTSRTAEAVVGFASENGIVMISPSSQSTSPPLVAPDTLFRLSLNDRYEADLIAIAASREGIETIIPVIRNDSYGRSYHAEFDRESHLVGIEVLEPVVLRHDASDLSDEAAELNRRVAALGTAPGDLDAVGLFAAATGEDLSALAAAAGYPLLSSVLWFEPGNLFPPLPIADPDTLRLASTAPLVSTSWVVPQTRLLDRVHDELLARTGSEPHQFSYAAYDAVFMLADAINRTAGPNGTYAGADVAAEIPAAAWRLDGLLGGHVALDANGDRHSPSSIIVWKSERGTGAWAEDIRVHLPEECSIGLGTQALAFGSVAAGAPSPAMVQSLVNTGTMAIESMSVSATPWTAQGSASEVLAAGATEIMTAGALPWTPLGGNVTIPGVALAPLDDAEIRFRLSAPAGVPQSAAGPIEQAVTYTASCG